MSNPEVKEWLEILQHDVDTAKLLLKEKGHADIIIYHLHQALEKLLKTLLIQKNINPERTHDLDKLLSRVEKEYGRLEGIRENIVTINLYLPKMRYPSGDKLTFEDAQDANGLFKKASKVLFALINE